MTKKCGPQGPHFYVNDRILYFRMVQLPTTGSSLALPWAA